MTEQEKLEYLLEILFRLREQRVDIGGEITFHVVEAVIQNMMEYWKQDFHERSLVEGLDTDDEPPLQQNPMEGVLETFLYVLGRGDRLPSEPIDRIVAILDAHNFAHRYKSALGRANTEPYSWKCYVSRGSAQIQLGRLDEGFGDYETALTMAAGDAEDEAVIRGDRAGQLFNLKRHEEALVDATFAASNAPEWLRCDSEVLRARLLLKTGNLEEAWRQVEGILNRIRTPSEPSQRPPLWRTWLIRILEELRTTSGYQARAEAVLAEVKKLAERKKT